MILPVIASCFERDFLEIDVKFYFNQNKKPSREKRKTTGNAECFRREKAKNTAQTRFVFDKNIPCFSQKYAVFEIKTYDVSAKNIRCFRSDLTLFS